MGLDMFLFKAPKKIIGCKRCEPDLWNTFEELAYWRKANCVHRWFLSNCKRAFTESSLEDSIVTESNIKNILSDIDSILEYVKVDFKLFEKQCNETESIMNGWVISHNKQYMFPNLKNDEIDLPFYAYIDDDGLYVAEKLLPTQE